MLLASLAPAATRWLVPLVVFLFVTAVLLLMATTVEALAPFIYSIFWRNVA